MITCLIAEKLSFGGGLDRLPPFACLSRSDWRKARAIMDISADWCRPSHAPLEEVQAEFLLELQMGLFADPAGLDRAGRLLHRRVGRQVREWYSRSPVVRCSWVSQTSSPGRRWAPSTRMTAKRTQSLPLIPCRQLTWRHFAVSNLVCADTEVTSGIAFFLGHPRAATGNYADVGRFDLLLKSYANTGRMLRDRIRYRQRHRHKHSRSKPGRMDPFDLRRRGQI